MLVCSSSQGIFRDGSVIFDISLSVLHLFYLRQALRKYSFIIAIYDDLMGKILGEISGLSLCDFDHFLSLRTMPVNYLLFFRKSVTFCLYLKNLSLLASFLEILFLSKPTTLRNMIAHSRLTLGEHCKLRLPLAFFKFSVDFSIFLKKISTFNHVSRAHMVEWWGMFRGN